MATVRKILEGMCMDFSDSGEQGTKLQLVIDALFNLENEGIQLLNKNAKQDNNNRLEESQADLQRARARIMAERLCWVKEAIWHILDAMVALASSQDVANIDVNEYTTKK